MKLVEIKDIRVGQIWKNEDENSLCEIDCINNDGVIATDNFEENFRIELAEDIFKRKFKLIGFHNITHTIKDNKLVEIPREEFEVETNDIIIQSIHIDIGCSTDSGVGCQMNDYREIIAVDKYEYLDFNGKYIPELSGVDVLNKNYKGDGVFTKIGILGITHKFINNKLED